MKRIDWTSPLVVGLTIAAMLLVWLASVPSVIRYIVKEKLK